MHTWCEVAAISDECCHTEPIISCDEIDVRIIGDPDRPGAMRSFESLAKAARQSEMGMVGR